MSIKIIIIILIVLVLGIVAYYWFDLGYQKTGNDLVTIKAVGEQINESVANEALTEIVSSSQGQSQEEAVNEDLANESMPTDTTTQVADKPTIATAYVAGGCFWCVEKDHEKIDGVGDVISGYSGGATPNPTYRNHADHREAVMIPYDPTKISYRELLHYFFRHHDGTDPGGSFYDRGHSYTSAIYYQTEAERVVAEEVKAELDMLGIFADPLVTAIEPFRDFTIAEDYHQNYYKRDPVSATKYRAYRAASGRDAFINAVAEREANLTSTEPVETTSNNEPTAMTTENTQPVEVSEATSHAPEHDWVNYVKPSDEVLKSTLTALEYKVTQQDGTERAGTPGNLDDEKRDGIFVDILSGEPLYSSRDKFDSGTGWPSFVKPIDMMFIETRPDNGLFYTRTEVRSKYADNHLGHVFNDGPSTHNGQPSTGQRWCMNGAALTFIPLAEMEEKGYGDYIQYVQ